MCRDMRCANPAYKAGLSNISLAVLLCPLGDGLFFPKGSEAPGAFGELLAGLHEQPARLHSPQLFLRGERLEELGAGQVRRRRDQQGR